MYFIDDQAININDIILEKGSQKYIFLNNTNSYNIKLHEDLKGSTNINIEVFLVSQVEKQAIDIKINDQEYTLDKIKGNNFLRINTKNQIFEKFEIRGKGTATLLRVKIGGEKTDKNIAYTLQYEKESKENIISRYKKVNIKNNNGQSVNLCYTYNFIEKDYIYNPKAENCFDLKEKEETLLTMYNPWNKYLENENNLFEKSDSYYLIIYAENENLIKNLEFSSSEEALNINSELVENQFININQSQNSLIKSSDTENKFILIQFSPVINVKNIINSNNDEFGILSQLNDNNIQKGKIFSQQNRTYVLFDDPLIDSYLSTNINSEMIYEIKYNSVFNRNNFKRDLINDNYKIELIFENNTNFVKFNPLFKNKNIIYNVFVFFDTKIEFISITYLINKIEDKNTNSDYILKEEINTKENEIKIPIKGNIAEKIKNEKSLITVLAEEKEIYNIIMNYDVLINTPEEKQKEGNGKNSGFIVGIIFLIIFIIILIVVLGYFAYKFFLKKKVKTDEELLEGINAVDASLNDENKSPLNYDEGL